MNMPAFISESTLPQWITAVASSGLLVAVLRFVIQWRGQTLNSEEQIRDHYSKEVEALRGALRDMEGHYRRMLEDSDRMHEECKTDRDALRSEVGMLRAELRGIKRQISRYSADQLLVMEERAPSDVAPDATESAKRIKRMP